MSQKDFKDLFLENILEFLWRQWSAIGVLGEARTKDPWLIDPEPMIIFTIEMGRYEPRLFDEVMDWLAVKRYHPMLLNPDRCFLSYGFHRPRLKLHRLTREAPITAQSSIPITNHT